MSVKTEGGHIVMVSTTERSSGGVVKPTVRSPRAGESAQEKERLTCKGIHPTPG